MTKKIFGAVVVTAALALSGRVGAQALPPGSTIPSEQLARLGFVPAGVPINSNSYVQLRVAVHVVGENNMFVLDKCPRNKLWDIDLGALVRGNTSVQLGANIVAPGLPAVPMVPLKVERKGSVFNRTCSVSLDLLRYRSPLYFVRMTEGSVFTVRPAYTASAKLDPTVQAALKTLVNASFAASGVPAASAKPYIDSLTSAIDTVGVSQEQSVTQHLIVAHGVTEAPTGWILPEDVLSQKKGGERQTVVVLAQLVPVSNVVPPPLEGGWQPASILATAYRVSGDAPPNEQTIRAHVYKIAGGEMERYGSASSLEQADAHCVAIEGKVRNLGLSDRDTALVLWSLARQRVALGRSTAAEVDNLSCLGNYREELGRAEVALAPPQPPAGPRTPPRSRQMKVTVEVDDAAHSFFVTSSWNERRRLAPALFRYPLQFIDEMGIAMRGSASIESHDSWLANSYERDAPILARFGCYSYFEGSHPHPFPDLAGRSVMLAIGETPSHQKQSREIAVLMSFESTAAGEDPRVDTVRVLDSITHEARSSARKLLAGSAQCRSGYRPKLIFD